MSIHTLAVICAIFTIASVTFSTAVEIAKDSLDYHTKNVLKVTQYFISVPHAVFYIWLLCSILF